MSFAVQAAGNAGNGLLRPIIGEQAFAQDFPVPFRVSIKRFPCRAGYVENDPQGKERVLVKYGRFPLKVGKYASDVGKRDQLETRLTYPGHGLVKQTVCIPDFGQRGERTDFQTRGSTGFGHGETG